MGTELKELYVKPIKGKDNKGLYEQEIAKARKYMEDYKRSAES